jgi:hypothetical protein
MGKIAGEDPFADGIFQENHHNLLADHGQGSRYFGTDETAPDDEEALPLFGPLSQFQIILQITVVHNVVAAKRQVVR